MDLKDFVRQALVNIVSGVAEAAEEMKELGSGAVISPRLRAAASDNIYSVSEDDGFGYAFPVKFDLSLTVSSAESQKKDMGGSFKISVLSARAGVEETDAATKTAVQRLQFSVPVKFPQTAVTKAHPRKGPPTPQGWT